MIIRTARKSDAEMIMSLWDCVFGDDADFTAWYFRSVFSLKDTIVCEKDNEIVSMLQRLHYKAYNIGDISYIFGACTRIDYRGQGLMESLINYCKQLDIKENKKACILIPQEESLFDYYKRFGFEPCFFANRTTEDYKGNVSSAYNLKNAHKADFEILNSVYERALEKTDYIIRDRLFWETQIDMIYSLGGECVVLLKGDKPSGYAFVWNEDGKKSVSELVCVDNTSYDSFVNLLMERYNIMNLNVVSLSESHNENTFRLGSAYFYDRRDKCEIKANLLYN